MTNLFAPRDTLIRHLRLLIDSNTLRSVESANEFADLLDGKLPFVHRAAYVVYDKYLRTRQKNPSSHILLDYQ